MAKTEKDPIDVEIGGRLRSLRTGRRISLEALGASIGVTYQQIQKYETGANRVAAATLVRIAAVFGVEPAEILPPAPMDTAPVRAGDPRVIRVAAALYEIDFEHRGTACITLEAAARAYGRAMA